MVQMIPLAGKFQFVPGASVIAETPNRPCISRCPTDVTLNARLCESRITQFLRNAIARTEAPKAPPMRTALAPIDAGADKAAPQRACRGDIDAECRECSRSHVRQVICLSVGPLYRQPSQFAEAIVQRTAKCPAMWS